MKRTAMSLVLVGALCLAGCGKQQMEELTNRMEALEGRIAELNETVRQQETQLAAQVAALEAAAVSNRVNAAATGLDAGLRQELTALVEKRISARIGTEEDIQAIFEDTFSDTMAEMEKQEEVRRTEQRDERRRQWEEARARREESRLKQLADDLQLDEQQAEQVKVANAEFNESMRQMMTDMRESGEFNLGSIRTNLDAVRAKRDEQMQNILTDEQFEGYKKRPSTLGFVSNMLRGFEQAGTNTEE